MERRTRPQLLRLTTLLCAGLLASGCGFVDLGAAGAEQQLPDVLNGSGVGDGGDDAADADSGDDSGAGGDCTDVRLLAARGTGEPGTLGLVVGDPLFQALAEQVESVSAAPVDYPSSSVTLTGVQQGADDVVDQLTEQADVCPNQQFALSGYSQGAMVIATSLADIPADVADRVAAIVLFGNPSRAQGTGEFNDRTLDICATGDTVCNGARDGSGVGHLSYGGDVGRAAEFIAEQLDG
jgi:cutinase